MLIIVLLEHMSNLMLIIVLLEQHYNQTILGNYALTLDQCS